MRSETDTEVVAQLLDREVLSGVDLTAEAMQNVCRRVWCVHPRRDRCRRPSRSSRHAQLAARGRHREGENFLGSDVAAFIEHTREAMDTRTRL